jgi:hypothetical protein
MCVLGASDPSCNDVLILLLPHSFRPNIPLATTRNVLMKDAFNPEEETERDWDIELRDDVKGEVEDKYGKVLEIFVVKESQVSPSPLICHSSEPESYMS